MTPLRPLDALHHAFRDASRDAVAPDRHGAFPHEGVARLREAGLLTAVLPRRHGGFDLCDAGEIAALRDLLVAVGRISLVLGRLYEGHVNAHTLVQTYGSEATRRRMAEDAAAGHLSGVWNTEPPQGGLALDPEGDGYRIRGVKNFASGAGFVTRPLVTGEIADARRVMVIAPLERGERADLSSWCAQGMRASATGVCDMTGLHVGPDLIVGEPNDYLRQPAFSCGAWRFLAVQAGGIEAVFEIHRQHLRRSGRGQDAHQLARLGQSATAVETARLFVARAAEAAATARETPDASIAAVNLARGAVERAGLDVIALAQRSVGLQGFLETHPLEQAGRDLATYLRQPAPDFALTNAASHLLESDLPLHQLWPVA